MRLRLTIAGTILTLLGLPLPVRAQADLFVQGVRELAAAAADTGPARARTIDLAAARMRTALVEWDRRLEAMRARVERDAPVATADGARRLWAELGVAYRQRGRLDDALRAFASATARQPAGSDLLLLRATTLEASGQSDDTAATFTAAFSADATSPLKAYYALQRGVASDGARARAVTALRDAYERLELRAGRPAAPFLVLDAVPDTLSRTPVVADEALSEPFARIAAGRYDEALDVLRPSAGAPDGPRAQFARAQQDEAGNRIADARRGYGAALRGTLAGRHVLYVGLARLAQVDGDTAAAIDAFKAAVRLAPNEPALHKELAGAYSADGRRDEAFAELMAALFIDPRDAQAHAAIGSLYVDGGRDAEGVLALTRALELAPDRHETRYALSRALTNLGRTGEAARQLSLFEEARRAALERRRRAIASDVEREEAERAGRPPGGGAR